MSRSSRRTGAPLVALVIHAALYWGTVLLDPGAMHNHEILQPAAAAHEFNRGNIPLSELHRHLNGEITVWETLELAGWFRLAGASYPITLLMAYLPALLIILLWHRVLTAIAAPDAAARAAWLLALAPPTYLLLSTQIDSRHIALNICLPLLLLLFLRGVQRARPAGALAFAGLAVFSLTLTRSAWTALIALGVVWLATGARSARWLLAGGAAALGIHALVPPVGWGTLVRFHQWTPLDLLHEHWSPAAALRLATATVVEVWPTSFALPAGGGILVLLLLAAGIARLRRRPLADSRGQLVAILLLFLVVYLVALAALRFDAAFGAGYAPDWWRYRYLVALFPASAALLALAAAGIPRPIRRAGLMLFAVLLLAGLPAAARFRGRPLASYSPFNYCILGEQVADQFAIDNHERWLVRLARFEPAQRESLVSGLAASAVKSERPPGHFARVLSWLPESEHAQFYRAAGYWSTYNAIREDRQRLLASIADPRRNAEFRAGQALARGGYEWWPEYHGIPSSAGLVE